MTLDIREYSRADWFSLITLSDDEWEENIRAVGLSLLNEYDGKYLKMLVAYNGDNLAGFIYGFVLPNHCLIPEFMYVKPMYRHEGIAQKLLNELEQQSNCEVSMIFYNKSLHDYYQRQGYTTGDNLETAIKQLSKK